MIPAYLNSQPSPFPIEYHEDDYQHHELLISPKSQSSSSSSPSPSSPIMFSNPSIDQGGYHHHGEIQLLGHSNEADTFVSHGGSYDHTTLKNESDKYGLKLPIWKKKDNKNNEDQSCENIDHNGSAKWMSSKMRLMRKMMNDGSTDHRSSADIQINTTPMFCGDQNKQLISSSPLEKDHNSNNNIVRVCSDCNTTKTPLWRSGPRGPKSLCNACGIRQRKARRAMAAAAAAANGTILTTATTSHVKTKVQHKDKKKRSKKLAAAPSSTGRSEKLCFEDFTLSLSEKYSAFQRVFPQDEKEAAILLMALSYGLVS